MTKTIEVAPGRNTFTLVGVQQHGTVKPLEYTESGWPKNTTTNLKEIVIVFYAEKGTCDIMVCDKV